MNLLKDLKNLATHNKNDDTENWYVTVERAEGVEDKDKWSKTDTYVVVEFGGQNLRTHTINNSRTPFWNETFNIKLPSDRFKDLRVRLMDDDFGIDDPIGSAVISKGDLPFNSGDEKYLRVPVFRQEQTTGIIVLRVKKFSDSDQQQHQHQHQHQQQQQQQQQPYSQSHDISSATNYQQQQPSNYQQQQPSNYQQQQPMYSQQQQPMYSQQQPTNYSQQQHHQPQVPPSTQQPYMGGGTTHTNYDSQFQQKKY